MFITDFVPGIFGSEIPMSVKIITEWPQSKQTPTFSISHWDKITSLCTTEKKKKSWGCQLLLSQRGCEIFFSFSLFLCFSNLDGSLLRKFSVKHLDKYLTQLSDTSISAQHRTSFPCEHTQSHAIWAEEALTSTLLGKHKRLMFSC